jgi:phosphohistidine phosphatase
MMPTLLLLRHLKSSWDDESLVDHDRPLSARGIRDGRHVAEHLDSLNTRVDLVLCSSAIRTRQTLELIQPALGDAAVEIEDQLYGASADTLLARLHGVPDSVGSALMIGHNPGMQDLALRIAASGPIRSAVMAKFPTGALATLALPDHPWRGVQQGTARLIGYTVPKDLR